MKCEEQKISYPGFKSYWVFQETAPPGVNDFANLSLYYQHFYQS